MMCPTSSPLRTFEPTASDGELLKEEGKEVVDASILKPGIAYHE